jgi:hypothetical protein
MGIQTTLSDAQNDHMDTQTAPHGHPNPYMDTQTAHIDTQAAPHGHPNPYMDIKDAHMDIKDDTKFKRKV